MAIITNSRVKVEPDYSIDNCPELGILIVPGGPLRKSMAKNQKVIDSIGNHKSVEYICSVCTGAYIFGATGLLDGKKATTHHLALKLLQEKYSENQVLSNQKVVQDGDIITTGGVVIRDKQGTLCG